MVSGRWWSRINGSRTSRISKIMTKWVWEWLNEWTMRDESGELINMKQLRESV